MYQIISLALTALFALLVFRKNEDGSSNWISTLVYSVIVFFLLLPWNYFGMPVITFWGFHGIWFQLAIITICAPVISSIRFDRYGDPEWKMHGEGFKKWLRWIPAAIVILIFFVVAPLSSWKIGRSDRFQSMITVKEAPDSLFNKNIHPISVKKMSLVPRHVAESWARKTLSEDPGLPSRVKLGKMTKQTFTGRLIINEGQELVFDEGLIYVAPLEHTGWLKWRDNRTTPGYVIVDATAEKQTAYLVRKINGKPIKIKYSEEACWEYNLERHLRYNGFMSEGITDPCFQIDYEGQPHWVLANYEKTIGFSAPDVSKVVTVDAQTGDIVSYKLGEEPRWADRIQPAEFIKDQINDWGKYRDGWWNGNFPENGVEQATDGMELIDVAGGSYWYTGIKSSGANDDATGGIMLIDIRNKEAMLYRISGLNETKAMKLASSLSIAGSTFEVNNPILYNINGIPSYLMTLTRGDAVIGYSFVSVKEERAIAWGVTIAEAERNYMDICIQLSVANGINNGPTSNIEGTYTVRDITLVGEEYYILLKELPGKEFKISVDASVELKWTKLDHKVHIIYGDGEGETVSIFKFENISFTL